MAATIQQIAELAGVSRGTVDRALNNRGRIKPEVAQKIQEIADELGYVPKHRGKSSSAAERVKIGVVTQLSKSSFMIEVNRGIQQACEELVSRGVEVVLRDTDKVDEQKQSEAIDSLLQEGIDALAIMPVESEVIRSKINELAEERNIPVITFNSDVVGSRRSCYVGLDNRKSGLTAAGLMAMLTRAAGKVLVITGYFSNSVNSMRVDGFVEEIKKSFPGMELVGVQSSSDNAEEVERIIINTMGVFPDLAGVFVVSGGQKGVRTAFEKLEVDQRPYVIIYDETPRNKEALVKGDVDFLIDQDGYVQGYRPIHILADMLQKGQEPESEYIYTDINIKTKYNI